MRNDRHVLSQRGTIGEYDAAILSIAHDIVGSVLREGPEFPLARAQGLFRPPVFGDVTPDSQYASSAPGSIILRNETHEVKVVPATFHRHGQFDLDCATVVDNLPDCTVVGIEAGIWKQPGRCFSAGDIPAVDSQQLCNPRVHIAQPAVEVVTADIESGVFGQILEFNGLPGEVLEPGCMAGTLSSTRIYFPLEEAALRQPCQ